MINSLEQLCGILVGTPFEFGAKISLAIPESQACAFAVKISPEIGLSRLDTWTFFRSILDKTQRWPVVVNCGLTDNWENLVLQADFFSRQEFKHFSDLRDDKEFSPEAIVARAKFLNLDHKIKELIEEEEEYLSNAQIIDYQLSYTLERFGTAPDKGTIPLSFTDSPHNFRLGLEKWLLDWEIENLNSEVRLAAPDLWYLSLDENEGSSHCDETLILLPTPNTWETLAYIHYFGGADELMISLFQSWHEQFGAELFSHDGVGMFFNVQRRPSTINEAFQLAIEQTSVADFHSLMGISVRDHARALLHIDHWNIWTKP